MPDDVPRFRDGEGQWWLLEDSPLTDEHVTLDDFFAAAGTARPGIEVRMCDAGTWLHGSPDPREAFESGSTIIISSRGGSHGLLPKHLELFATLTGYPIQCNLYLTPPGRSGLAPHCDFQDVFVVQLHGMKRWIGAAAGGVYAIEGGVTTSEYMHASQLFDIETRPGSILHIARGVFHRTIALNHPSLHATFGTTWSHYCDTRTGLLESSELAFVKPLLPPRPPETDALAIRTWRAEACSRLDELIAEDPARYGVAAEMAQRMDPPPLGPSVLRGLQLRQPSEARMMAQHR